MSQTLTLPNLIDAIASRANLAKGTVRLVLEAQGAVVSDALAEGSSVRLPELGTLAPKASKPRSGRVNGTPYTKPASTRVSFTAGKALKTAVNP